MAIKSVGDLRVGLLLDKSGFDAGLKSAGASTETFTHQLMKLAGTYLSMQQAVGAFNDMIAEDIGFNRVIANMKRLSIYTPEAADSVERLTFDMEYLGAKQTELYAEMMPLLTLTKDVAQTTGLLSMAQRASISTGSPLGQVVRAVADAMQGQERTLRPLLREWGEYSEKMETVGDFLEIVRRRAGESTEILTKEALAVFALKKSFEDLKEETAKTAGPTITKMLQGWAMLMTTISYWAEKLKLTLSETSQDIQRIRLTKLDLQYQTDIGRIQGVDAYGNPINPISGAESGTPAWWDELMKKYGSTKLGTGGKEGAKSRRPREGQSSKLKFGVDTWRREREEERRIIEENAKALQQYQDELDRWNLETSPTFMAAQDLAYLFGDTLTGAMTDFQDTFANMGETLKRVLAELISKILMLKMMGWMETAFKLPAGSLTGAPQPPKPAGAGTSGFRGGDSFEIRPIGLPTGTIYQLLRNDRIEFSKYAEEVYTIGGAVVASR